MKYEKIIKWVLVALFVLGVAISLYGFVVGFETNGNSPVDVLLYGTYAYALVALLAVVTGVVVIGGINNPKTLVKMLLGLVVAAVVVGGAYMLAPGTPAVGYLGEPVSDGTLKLTDTVLNLTYLAFGASIVALIVGWIAGATRK